MLYKIVIIALTLMITTGTYAQTVSRPEGKWKGNSICQVKNSPCHDEIVVYHVDTIGTNNRLRIQMNKIVNLEEEDMGSLIFTYDGSSQTLVSTDTLHHAVWTFHIQNDTMDGTLVYKSMLYRLVHLTRQPQ